MRSIGVFKEELLQEWRWAWEKVQKTLCPWILTHRSWRKMSWIRGKINVCIMRGHAEGLVRIAGKEHDDLVRIWWSLKQLPGIGLKTCKVVFFLTLSSHAIIALRWPAPRQIVSICFIWYQWSFTELLSLVASDSLRKYFFLGLLCVYSVLTRILRCIC